MRVESGLAGGGNPAGALAVVLGSVTRALGGAAARCRRTNGSLAAFAEHRDAAFIVQME